MTGLFVALEGPKFVGKTTLLSRLKEQTSEAGEWLLTKEPTEKFDLGDEQRRVGAELATLIAEDRRQHIAEVIQPALQQGQVVVTDRYVLSSYVFHCLDGVNPEVVRGLNAGFPAPDMLVVLLCRPETLRKRRVQRGQQTRLSKQVSAENEILAYLSYVDACRPTSGEITLCYNETMDDCHFITQQLIATVRTWKQ